MSVTFSTVVGFLTCIRLIDTEPRFIIIIIPRTKNRPYHPEKGWGGGILIKLILKKKKRKKRKKEEKKASFCFGCGGWGGGGGGTGGTNHETRTAEQISSDVAEFVYCSYSFVMYN